MAGQNSDIAAIVKIVDAEGAFPAGHHGEIAAGDAKVFPIYGVHIKGSRALAEDQARGAGAILERKIVKLENGVFVEKGHSAILKFDFGTAIVGGKNVTLADRQICLGLLPDSLLIRERVSLGLAGKAHVTLNEAEANDPGVAGAGECRLDADGKNEEKGEGKDRTKQGAGSHVSPPSGTLAELLSRKTDGRRVRLRPCDSVAIVSRGVARVK